MSGKKSRQEKCNLYFFIFHLNILSAYAFHYHYMHIQRE